MGNVAVLLKKGGNRVGGSDVGAYPPISDLLAGEGISVDLGFQPEDLRRFEPEIVVVGNAVSRGNRQVEMVWGNAHYRVMSLPEVIDQELVGGRRRLVVSGTHGKTTTASYAAYLGGLAGLQPGYLIGGYVPELGGGAALGGETGVVILEGDEYDSAFFDKRGKFLHYKPDVLVINNIEFDHADIFRDLAEVERSFRHLLATVKPGGKVFYNGDDVVAKSLFPVGWCSGVSVGFGEGNERRLSMEGHFLQIEGSGDRLEVGVSTSVGAAEHLLRNAAMAALAVRHFGGSQHLDLSGFSGVKRRMELLGANGKWEVLEDFGHHPTAIRLTIEARRRSRPSERLWVAFEPRSNTACTNVFERDFALALGLADRVFLGPVFRAERYSEEKRLSLEKVQKIIETERNVPAVFASTNEEILELIERQMLDCEAEEGKTSIVFFTNGSFGGIQHCLAARISERE